MILEQFMKLIKSRRSIRRFTDDPVDRNDLIMLIEAALWAPSAGNIHATEYIIVDEATVLKRMLPFITGVWSKPTAIICICLDKDREQKKVDIEHWLRYGLMDIAMAAQNILLTAHAIGLACCVVASFDATLMQRFLKTPDNLSVELLILVGHAAVEAITPDRRQSIECIHWQRWKEEDC